MALGSRRHRGRGLETRVGIPVSGTIYYDTKYSDDNNTAENNFNIITRSWIDPVAPEHEFWSSIYECYLPSFLFLPVIIRVAQGVMVAQGNTWTDSASRDTNRGEIGIKLSLICNHITLWALSSRISTLKHQQSIEQATLILQDRFSISVKEFGMHSPEFQSLKTGLHQCKSMF